MVTMHTGVNQYNMPSKGSGSEWDMLELGKKNKFGSYVLQVAKIQNNNGNVEDY